ncbi:ParB/RepB/Spo0J family partition protein [Streptomyces marincola]|uniref:ParB/RepB/Spo0J family partition protein n=1 Tax=Streptomyces marincola TaxID=2878388 RepID=UPI001CF2C53E|nr:ParB N-terminal domain-containing protein [Streptomyces marincola]UCM88023.1 ParB N-terminal domain-containing protein [Streptomyces marincola]
MTEPGPAGKQTVRHDVGRLDYLDPHDLTVDPFNHRKKRQAGDPTEPDPKLVASVKAAGVQVPLLVRPQADGVTMGVIWGQRRLGAALIAAAEAKRKKQPYALVPCLVREDLAGADDEALVASMVENTHRMSASERDDVDALTQLSLMELTDAKRTRHAAALGYRPVEIRAANRAAKLDDSALASVIAAEFDLVEAADYADVSSVPGALPSLSRAKAADREEGKGRRGHWAHALQRLRQEKETAARRAEAVARLKASGVQHVAHHHYWGHGTARPLADLRTALGNALTPERHATDCQGHAAALDPETCEPVYVCVEWKKHGHQLDEDTVGKEKAEPASSRVEAVAERRRVIAYNRAWRAAREVRSAFITELCARKTASDAAWALILSTITSGSDSHARYTGRRSTTLTARFLGIAEADDAERFDRVVARTGRSRRWRPLLAHVAAVMETEVMGDRAWRKPNGQLRAWLGFLAAEGYTLSEIEQEMRRTSETSASRP